MIAARVGVKYLDYESLATITDRFCYVQLKKRFQEICSTSFSANRVRR